ncbi:MAG: hypothetical protein F6K57_26945, partial [Moorea sp. SIO4A5]|nr:hypothetical protein [Moorena sp. SIO4A5]
MPNQLWKATKTNPKELGLMTRQPHDQFAKQYLTELLTPHGQVEVSRELTTEV